MTVEFLLLLLGVIGGSTGTALVKSWFDRRRQGALTSEITAKANEVVFESYRDLITDLRRDAELARTEARDARHEAREARLRAADAEEVAAQAVDKAAQAQAALAEVLRIVSEAADEELLRRVERVAARAR